jgi:hypothetical protein
VWPAWGRVAAKPFDQPIDLAAGNHTAATAEHHRIQALRLRGLSSDAVSRGWRLRWCSLRIRSAHIFGPGAEVSEHCHQCDADDADQNLHPYTIRDFDERYVDQNCKNNTEAEHFKRLLTALDGRPERWPMQARPVARHEPRDEEGQDDEMNEPVGREVGLVIGVERINKPRRHHVSDFGESPRHRHDQCEHEVGAP